MLKTPWTNLFLVAVGWLACIWAGTSLWLIIPVAILVLHFTWVSSWVAEGKLVACCLLAGAALDSFLLQMGLLRITGEPVLGPLWLALVWALLGISLNHALAWTSHPWWRASLVGAIAAPLLYLGFASRDDFELAAGTQRSLIVIALAWAIMLPLLHGFAHLHREQRRLQGAK